MIWKVTCYIAAAVLADVGVVLLVTPVTQIAFLGAPLDAGAAVMGTRSAPLFLAMALVFVLFAPLEASTLRRRFAAIAAFFWSLIVATGTWHFLQGAVSGDVFGAVVVEGVLALVFLAQIRSR
ncbi:MAG: hypothetical protein AAGF13_01045 [Pseudomonadota bacterium]